MTAVPTDEIYERYLQKAIAEVNELWHELGELSDALHVPVVASGHPLADVFLLKWAPQPAEIQEGVAFYGRAGQALLKSFERFTATVAALVTPDIDASLDEQGAKTQFWNAFKALGPWWAELPPY